MVSSFRDLILQFRAYRSLEDLASIADELNPDFRNPVSVYLTSLARLPESLDACATQPGYSATEHLRLAMLSDEFQSMLITNLLNAFPEFRRLLFAHVPKCAGSDVRTVLGRRYFHFDHSLGAPQGTPKEQMFGHLRDFATNIDVMSRDLLICGHFSLTDYMRLNLRRAQDRLFTVLRDPVERVISHINYVVTVMKNDLAMERPDIRIWASQHGLERFDGVCSGEELGIRLLGDPAFSNNLRNVMCSWMSSEDATFRSAHRNIKITNMEVVLLKHYETWLTSQWGAETERVNRSEPWLCFDSLPPRLRTYLVDELVKEDLKLYEFLCREDASASRTVSAAFSDVVSGGS